ncbi:hypothetical protein CAL26_21775 [Bordetella genomosp. 9]|uniref:Uncharacterized protein n=1 Tax=Bordetella genomosp. 9 TaxID=1416803 RepID=A0A261R739_9BORD|nr:hypothetical protein [Bordetella genomosp. 9]OZI20173.1 hypothetical protein CAL26_21775 [Bordetella genomosp. 9]
MAIQLPGASPSALGAAGMAGIETPRGRLGARVFRTCRSRVTRAARSISRLVERLIHARTPKTTLIGTRPGGGPRASLARLALRPVTGTCMMGGADIPAMSGSTAAAVAPGARPSAGAARIDDPDGSPGAWSSRSSSSPARTTSTGTPAGSPAYCGVRLKPGISPGTPPAQQPDAGMPPPLPARSKRLEDLFNGKLSPDSIRGSGA